MVITEDVEIEDLVASREFSDIRSGRHQGHLVAVKTLRIAGQDDLRKVRQVGVGAAVLTNWQTD
jgi:hypothetical protein